VSDNARPWKENEIVPALLPYEYEQGFLRDRIMSDQTHNSQLIDKYLLDSLDEAETERFDGLSITDDQFAAALDAAENDLVDAYVQGEINGDELERFKSRTRMG